MEYRDIIEYCYRGDGEEKLNKAAVLVSSYGSGLSKDTKIQEQLLHVKDVLYRLEIHMASIEMGSICSTCAKIPGGGCCSAYMGNENNDVLQLVMNLLAGVDVRMIANNEEECCFLAKTGCILAYKPIFCLNYLCGKIRKKASKTQLRLLEKKTAELLNAQLQLEQSIMFFLQTQEMVEEVYC